MNEGVEKAFCNGANGGVKFCWLGELNHPMFLSLKEASLVLKDKSYFEGVNKEGTYQGEAYEEGTYGEGINKIIGPGYFTPEEIKIFKKLSSHLEGRALLLEELVETFEGLFNRGTALTPALLQKLILYFGGSIVPSIKEKKMLLKRSSIVCNRCLSKNSTGLYCPRCRENCYLCKDCLKMGEVRACTPLILFPGFNDVNDNSTNISFENIPKLDFELTPAQKDAFERAEEFVHRPETKALVFSLCGGGKTEAVFGAIAKALREKKRVLFATPRRDITRELYHRLKAAFVGVKIKAFYGGHKNKDSKADIIICTTHQLFRFYRAFHLVILDEADAFPYRGSANLPHLLERALIKGGKLIYVTATPEKPLLKEVLKKKSYLITIPARFHKKPAPLPELTKIPKKSMEGEGGKFHHKIIDFLKRGIREKKPVIVFVPTIARAEKTAKKLAWVLTPGLTPGPLGISFSHSKDSQRDKKLKDFSEGKLKILVATTILERGITLKGVRVLVLFSHEEIFDERALVQMAGRSGRTLEDPHGEVLFAGEYITPAMKRARKLIKGLNEEAKRKGYLEI